MKANHKHYHRPIPTSIDRPLVRQEYAHGTVATCSSCGRSIAFVRAQVSQASYWRTLPRIDTSAVDTATVGP